MRRGTYKLTVFMLSTTMLFGAVAMAAAQGSGSATLDAVKARGQMLCGVHGQVPGFSLPDSQGVMRGPDADTCRAMIAAVLSRVPLTITRRIDSRRHRFVVGDGWSILVVCDDGAEGGVTRVGALGHPRRGGSGARHFVDPFGLDKRAACRSVRRDR
jgi:hypothetical protein